MRRLAEDQREIVRFIAVRDKRHARCLCKRGNLAALG